VTQAYLEAFDRYRGDPGTIVDAWRERSATLGREVWVRTAGEELVGTIEVYEPNGVVLAGLAVNLRGPEPHPEVPHLQAHRREGNRPLPPEAVEIARPPHTTNREKRSRDRREQPGEARRKRRPQSRH